MSTQPRSDVPPLRLETLNDRPVREAGSFVLYWMIAQRRTRFSYGLDRALDWARHLDRPLLVLEALRCDYPWASDRLHRFVIDGMRDNARRLAKAGITYLAYVEPTRGAGKGLLEALARRAALVVTDEFPCFFLPRMTRAAAGKLDVRLESVDSNGLLPLRATPRVFPTAYAFRRFLQQALPEWLEASPRADPLRGGGFPAAAVPRDLTQGWPPASIGQTADPAETLAGLPIDHGVSVAPIRGGSRAGSARLKEFVESGLGSYADKRNDVDADTTSGLSPYLHFGHVSAHEVFHRIARAEDWSPGRLSDKASGKRAGWWGLAEAAEGFLDQLVTWRELGYNMSSKLDDYDRYASLPHWARETLRTHEQDPREHVYSRGQFERATTHDPLWNAAQRQLVRDGTIHNYLRMLWGKKILEWSPSPRRALETMVHLNNKYALDGRNPNSYSGIFWILGRYDRPWGPERSIFGKVRYMSSANTARKMRLDSYLRCYA